MQVLRSTPRCRALGAGGAPAAQALLGARLSRSLGFFLTVGLVLIACERKPKPEQKVAAVVVPTASPRPSPAEPPAPWPVGTWQAELEPGVMKLVMTESGEVSGSFDYRGDPVHVSGLFEGEPVMLRLKLTATAFYGTLVCLREGDTWVGQLRASPQAQAQFENDAGPFGEEWSVTLHRQASAEQRK